MIFDVTIEKTAKAKVRTRGKCASEREEAKEKERNTKKEREEPKVINGSRKKRIATGAGADVSTINKLLKQFKMMTEMMKKMSKGKTNPTSSGAIPDELLNQLKLK